MGKVGYDQFEGLRRLGEARAKLDDRAAIILTYHAALEREMDVVLARLLPRSEKLRGLGFGQKLAEAFDAILPGAAKVGDVELVAAGLVGYLADGPLNIDKLKLSARADRPIRARPQPSN